MLGLMRTLAQERPRQEMHDVDIDMYAPSDVSAQGLATSLMDLESAIRQNTWLQSRLLHGRVSSSLSHSQLVPSPRGSLSSLAAHTLDSGGRRRHGFPASDGCWTELQGRLECSWCVSR